MIDRSARDVAIRRIEQYFGGLITNDEFLDEFPKSSKDPALVAIYRKLFDIVSDMYSHTILQSIDVDPAVNAIVVRCLLFLRSDFEYRWTSRLFRIVRGLRQTNITGNLKSGDPDVWPFFTAADYQSVSSL